MSLHAAPGQLGRGVRGHDLGHVVQPSLVDDERGVEALISSLAVGPGDDAEVVEVGVGLARISAAHLVDGQMGRCIVFEGAFSCSRHHGHLAGVHEIGIIHCIMASTILLLWTLISNH